MDDRAKRIVETAVALAERDGYQAVRLRDVAATAQVALGTVYKRFASKEEILIAALEQESEKLVAKIGKKPVPGDSSRERVGFVFSALTKGLLRRPNLAKYHYFIYSKIPNSKFGRAGGRILSFKFC